MEPSQFPVLTSLQRAFICEFVGFRLVYNEEKNGENSFFRQEDQSIAYLSGLILTYQLFTWISADFGKIGIILIIQYH